MVDIGLGLLLGGGPRVTIEKGYGSAITPDGNRLYLASEAGFVTVVDALSNSSIGERIPVGVEPDNFAITPDGLRAYVADFNEKGQVHVIDTSSRQLVGAPIDIKETEYAASSPDGRKVFFSQFGPDTVTGLDTTTNQVIGPIPTGKGVGALAFVPDQSPTAAFKLAKRVRPGVAATLDGSPSSDSDGTVSSWSWVFQGGAGTGTTKPKLKHTFAKPGKFKVTLTVTDNEGCSINLVFTGQTAYCHGSPAATVTKTVKVAYPGVKVRCPKSASGACSFRLKAVERHGKKLTAQSAVAKAKAKPGKTAVVTLKPKKKFAKKLAGAKKALVQQIMTIAGRQTTKVSKLKIVR